MRRSSRWSRFAALAAAVALMLTLAPSSQAQRPIPLKHASLRVLYMAPIYLGIEKGFFREEGIDLQNVEIESGILGSAAILGGQAHWTDLDPLQVGTLRDQGIPMLLIYNLVRRVTLDFILRTEVAERLRITPQTPIMDRFRALRGLNIGITRPGAPTDVFPRYFLRRAGFDPDREANMIQVGGVPALGAALRTGRIDGFMLSPPLPQQLEKEGVGRIVIKNTAGDVPEIANLVYVALATTEPFTRNNPALTRAYLRAVNKANTWMRSNQAEALRILQAKYFSDTQPDVLKLSWDALLPAISPDGRFNEDGIRQYVRVFETIGRTIRTDTAEGTIWTNQYLR